MQIARSLLACCLVLLASGQASAPPGGTITGEVQVFNQGKLVAKPTDLWVYLEDERRSSVRPGKGVEEKITQKDKRFVPRVLVIPVGATVAFPNRDREEHNVFSPGRSSIPLFDLLRYGPGKSKSQKFLALGEFDIYCDIHMEMSSTIKVVPTTRFAPVGSDGTFQFTNVPAGRYKVVAWAPASRDVKSELIELASGETEKTQPLHLQKGVLATTHLRKDGLPYDYKQR